jgi:predicted negative regulator of RcsB-dependent stress response
MKSAHRHQLETNALAHRLEVYIDRLRPYGSQIAGVLVAIAVVLLIWTYVSNSSASKRSGAWDTFNQNVSATYPNIDEIHRTAQEYQGTMMQQMADVTWADAQVMLASRAYFANRKAANDAMDRALSAYQGVLQSTKDERLTNRARLGLARIYEMQNHLDKARAQYREVTGAYADYAKREAERLEKPEAQETYTWLATAQPPRPQVPMGPGVPGQRPDFSPGDIGLPGMPGPGASRATGPGSGSTGAPGGASDAFDALFNGPLQPKLKDKETDDRYGPGQTPPADGNTKPGDNLAAPESKDASPTPSAPPAPPTTPEPPKDEKKAADTSSKSDQPAK